ncbi:MAG: hypothetical protein O3A46_16855, partial [Candidatus Poribacteria bacterium]|nr:hypothetical protein [Candidatus Poribacteria bacterium]
FNDRRDDYLGEFPTQFIGLYDGDIVYTGTNLDNLISRGQLARERGQRNKGMYLKKVVPPADEIETYSVYEALLSGERA